jgi:hypothetical protein
MPAGVTASPSQFSLAAGAQETVTISAASTATAGSASVSVTGTSGTLSHTGQITLSVTGPQDFTLTVQPSSVSVATGSWSTVTIGVTGTNGFAAQASITISGLPAGVMATPSQFSLSPGGQETVTISAGPTAAMCSVTLTVTATSGSLDHSGQVGLEVTPAETSAYPPQRTRYVRTDAQWDSGFLYYLPQQWVVYDPGTKRLFVSNTWLNRIDVFDATSEVKIGEIAVPEPWVGDESLDDTTIYMGTQIGDLYEIAPVAMTVTKRIPALEIGPAGYPVYEVRVMADGKLALLSGQGGIPDVDGYSSFAVWNPADNSLVSYQSQYDTGSSAPVCNSLEAVFQFTLTADKTKMLLGSSATLCMLDPNTGEFLTVQVPAVSGFISSILVPPDGKEIIAGSSAVAGSYFGPGPALTVYDGTGLFETGQISLTTGGSGSYVFVLSFDGNTLYVLDTLWGGASAYNWRTDQQTGWFPSFSVDDPTQYPGPLFVDPTGLIVAPIGQGVAFLDGAVSLSAQPQVFPYAFSNVVNPGTGPVQGGTPTVIQIPVSKNLGDVYFGEKAATGVSATSSGTSATTPSGSPGPADIEVTTTDGGLLMLPEGFSYGPTILEVVPNASTAEGGGTGVLWGYGFGPAGNVTAASGLSVSVGGQSATITSYSGQPPLSAYPFPVECIQFTFPPGTAGTRVDVTVTSSSGSTTAKGAIQYLPALQQYPATGAVLAQGIYDSKRDLYYFTDQAEIRVFSKTQEAWLAPMTIPKAGRLIGLALSPNGSRLAVADAGNDVIDVLNPDSPSAISTYALPNTAFDAGTAPNGVAVTDSGIVYYATFETGGTGAYSLHKLNTATGSVSDYSEFNDGGGIGDPYIKILLSSDSARLYFNIDGIIGALDTATDTIYENPPFSGGDNELTLSSNQTWMSAEEYLMDTNLNVESGVALNERETWNQEYVYGEKMSPDGNLLFAPLTNSIDVYDGRIGLLRTRVALPVALSANYDALASDGKDNVLVAITGQNGDGIAVVDLSSLPEPLPLPYSSVVSSDLSRMKPFKPDKTKPSALVHAARAGGKDATRSPRRIPHRMTPLTVLPRVRR